MTEQNNRLTKTEFLLYRTEDDKIRIETRMENETVWLTQAQMCELFDKNKRTISEHIRNIFSEGELQEEQVVRKFRTTAADGKNYLVAYYNLDVIISVGYRVKSHRGTQFRMWATQRLREYIIKGFTMDDERLKQTGDGNYFDELLARIRDIRSSEKVFWRKVLDIYATSIDYDPNTDTSRTFFATIQNKIHWAAHGQTAAEVIYGRADSNKPNMGLTNWLGDGVRKSETAVAKNYLTEEELDVLNRIVTAYLEFAELQAINRNPMYMRDWIAKLEDFLKLSGRDILTHAGKISHEKALEKAHQEYEKYRRAKLAAPTAVEKHFINAEKKIKKLESGRKRKDKKG
jgi:hypothetical protein